MNNNIGKHCLNFEWSNANISLSDAKNISKGSNSTKDLSEH